MQRLPLAVVVSFCVSCTSCMEKDLGDVSLREVCDGSTALRLSATLIPNGNLGDANRFVYQSGGIFLQLDGACVAWVAYSPGSGAAAVRTLRITDDEWPTIQRRLQLASWNELAGSYPEPELDATTFEWASATAVLRCFGSCDSSPLAPLREQTFLSGGVIEGVWSAGTEIPDGPLELMVLKDPGASPVGPWPFDLAPQDIEGLEAARRVESASALADQLRAQRIEHSADLMEYGAIPFDAAGVTYLLYVRDIIPFETPR